jgi:hypothetical protein
MIPLNQNMGNQIEKSIFYMSTLGIGVKVSKINSNQLNETCIF